MSHARPEHWREIAPGIYVDESSDPPDLHLDVPRLLKANGYTDTPANRELMCRVGVPRAMARYHDHRTGMKGSNPPPPSGAQRPTPSPNPPPAPARDRGEDYMRTLPDVCAALFPHAVLWRDVVYSSNVDSRGVVHGQENRDEIEAIDAFIAACRYLGLDGG